MKYENITKKYEKIKNERYTFGVLEMNEIREKSTGEFDLMAKCFEIGYIRGYQAESNAKIKNIKKRG